MTTDHAVRAAARALFDAIRAAEADGYRVAWPAAAAGLAAIGVSETARVAPAPATVEETRQLAELPEEAPTEPQPVARTRRRG